MSWLGIYSHQLNNPTNEFFKLFTPYCWVSGTIACIWYAFENLSIHIRSSLGAMKIVCGTIQACDMFLSFGMKMIEIKSLHVKLQEIQADQV